MQDILKCHQPFRNPMKTHPAWEGKEPCLDRAEQPFGFFHKVCGVCSVLGAYHCALLYSRFLILIYPWIVYFEMRGYTGPTQENANSPETQSSKFQVFYC